MKRLIEKLLTIYHIIIGGQYAIFIISNNFDKNQRCCCLISDNSDKVFLETVIETTETYIKTNI